MSDNALIFAIAGVLIVVAMLPYVLRHRRLERDGAVMAQLAHDYGLHEPVSLHPVVNQDLCICTGNCVAVCPENVLAIRSGQTIAVAPASCVGHGLCERSCPVNAIQLVFGSEKRGVELPRIQQNFETNVPGLYIVGELGGMGLIRNAFEQARQCIDGIARQRSARTNVHLDIAIVGCGPAGLAAALYAQHHGLNYTVIEKEDVGGTVRYYPRKKIVLTDVVKVPGYGKLDFREISKEDLIDVWEEIIQRTSLQVHTSETIEDVQRTPAGTFSVRSADAHYEADRVILAIGRRGVPRKLGVPGEDSPNVAYALREAEAYSGDRILVVGGGDSAVEAALALAAQRGTRVEISYRGEAFSRLKQKNREAIQEALLAGRVAVHWRSHVTCIEPGTVHLMDDGGARTLGIDRVFVFIGGTLPTAFLKKCGVAVDTKFGTA